MGRKSRAKKNRQNSNRQGPKKTTVVTKEVTKEITETTKITKEEIVSSENLTEFIPARKPGTLRAKPSETNPENMGQFYLENAACTGLLHRITDSPVYEGCVRTAFTLKKDRAVIYGSRAGANAIADIIHDNDDRGASVHVISNVEAEEKYGLK